MTVIYERRELSREVAYTLAMARVRRGWTLKQAGERIGCSISSVHAYENGVRVPSVALAGDIARAYSLSQEDTIALMAEAVSNAGRSKPRGKAKAAA
jgi:transcriptional regulator with XRE-family HTH domain